jgi:hypothetical protein
MTIFEPPHRPTTSMHQRVMRVGRFRRWRGPPHRRNYTCRPHPPKQAGPCAQRCAHARRSAPTESGSSRYGHGGSATGPWIHPPAAARVMPPRSTPIPPLKLGTASKTRAPIPPRTPLWSPAMTPSIPPTSFAPSQRSTSPIALHAHSGAAPASVGTECSEASQTEKPALPPPSHRDPTTRQRVRTHLESPRS